MTTPNGLLACFLDPADIVSVIRYKSAADQAEILRLLLLETTRKEAALIHELLAKAGWQI